jgi:hypothetical protein
MEDLTLSEAEQHRRLIEASGKLKFLKLLLPELKSRGFRILLFSQVKALLECLLTIQFKIVLDRGVC